MFTTTPQRYSNIPLLILSANTLSLWSCCFPFQRFGGGIDAYILTISLQHVNIFNNHASVSGGGMELAAYSKILMDSCNIHHNTAEVTYLYFVFEIYTWEVTYIPLFNIYTSDADDRRRCGGGRVWVLLYSDELLHTSQRGLISSGKYKTDTFNIHALFKTMCLFAHTVCLLQIVGEGGGLYLKCDLTTLTNCLIHWMCWYWTAAPFTTTLLRYLCFE